MNQSVLKTTAIMLILAGGLVSCEKEKDITTANVFYYYQGEKIFLTERTDKIFLKLAKGANKEKILALIYSDSTVELSLNLEQDEPLPDFLTLEVTKTGNIASVVERYRANTDVISASPVLQYNEILIGLADEFTVKLKEMTSLKELQKLLLTYHCTIVEENEFVKNQFLLSVSKVSALNALQLSNLFYETGLFEFSEPNFIILNAFYSNDTYLQE
jgi:hypothetical protein